MLVPSDSVASGPNTGCAEMKIGKHQDWPDSGRCLYLTTMRDVFDANLGIQASATRTINSRALMVLTIKNLVLAHADT